MWTFVFCSCASVYTDLHCYWWHHKLLYHQHVWFPDSYSVNKKLIKYHQNEFSFETFCFFNFQSYSCPSPSFSWTPHSLAVSASACNRVYSRLFVVIKFKAVSLPNLLQIFSYIKWGGEEIVGNVIWQKWNWVKRVISLTSGNLICYAQIMTRG